MALTITVNGQPRNFAGLDSGTTMAQVVNALDLKADRIAVEHNGEIAPRTGWGEVFVADGDRLEVVHFVGGGGVEQACRALRVSILEQPLAHYTEYLLSDVGHGR